MRLAVQEGATALVCSLMPAIEPVVLARACPAGFRVWEHSLSTYALYGLFASIGSVISASPVLGRLNAGWVSHAMRAVCNLIVDAPGYAR